MLEEDLGSANSVKGNLVDTSPSLSPHNQLNMTQNSHVPNLTPQQASCSNPGSGNLTSSMTPVILASSTVDTGVKNLLCRQQLGLS